MNPRVFSGYQSHKKNSTYISTEFFRSINSSGANTAAKGILEEPSSNFMKKHQKLCTKQERGD